MNKAELREKWSKYCDVDKLVDGAIALAKKHKHKYSEHGICTLLDESLTAKEDKIKLFVTSPNYIGDLRIVVQKEFERQTNSDEIYNFFVDIAAKLNADELYKKQDESGNTLIDYLRTEKNLISVANLPSAEAQQAKSKLIKTFDLITMATQESVTNRTYFLKYMAWFQRMPRTKLSDDFSFSGRPNMPRLVRGTKTSRAFNKVCQHFGVDKFCPTEAERTDANGNVTTHTVYPYDKVFAQYSDLVSDLKRKMYFVISLNPLDYLTMSFGVSWVSCHNISSGGYMGGCLSYMLDSTSIITFVVNELEGNIHELPKYYRQMVHYDNGLFVQNRLYPQGNDGATDLYSEFRGYVIEEFAKMIHEDGEWDTKVGPRYCKEHISSAGIHYKDYCYNNSCNIFYPKSKKDIIKEHVMRIGHDGICIKCGQPFTESGRLSHSSCRVEVEVE